MTMVVGSNRVWGRALGSVWLTVGALLLTACGGNAQPAIVVIQPSATGTATVAPTTSPTADQPVLNPTAISLPPTREPTTPTPGPSPTYPVEPTLSPAPATLTATRAPTLAGLSVEYFTTDSESVKPGDNVTLFWSLRGAHTAQIFRIDALEERVWRWDVNIAGKITVETRAEDRDVARFLLVGEADGVTVEQPLLIPMQCPEIWFFDQAPNSCPAAPPQLSTQAEQTFERGRMIWVEAQDRIYVVFEDGNTPTWAQYPDNFAEGDPEKDETLVPPPGLQQPIRGFGLVWRSNPRVQDRLGWATTSEVAFEGMFQADAIELGVATLYLRMRDGGIMALNALDDTWTVLPPVDSASY